MTEFLGSRISLISKRDIRYVGTLHEISSEHSTVALEQVVSYGTEGRRPEDEVPPSDNVYEYIVFRGSDVKDLRIEEPPKETQPPKPPQVPDDPAILGSARRPTPASTPQAPTQAPTQAPPQQPQPQPQQQRQPQPQHPQFPQQPPFPYYYGPPPNQRFGPQGFPPGPGFPGMPYGAPPPGWYPPPGHGFPPPPGQFHPGQMPIAPPGQQHRQQGPQLPPIVPNGPSSNKEGKVVSQQPSPAKPVATVKLPSTSTTPITTPIPSAPTQTGLTQKAPTPPAESKPDVAAALAPPVASTAAPPAPAVTAATITPTKRVPTGPKSGRIMPAIPLPSPAMKAHVPVNGPLQSTSGNAVQSTTTTALAPPAAATRPSQAGTKSIEDANRDARAAVAAAMAKLPPAPAQRKQTDGESAIDNLTKKVNEMRTNDNIRTSRQPGTGGYAAGHRGGGGRGGHRGGRPQQDQQTKKVEVPTTDYDFESANAKFNKQDLVKEAIASGSPAATSGETPIVNGASQDAAVNGSRRASEQSVVIPPAAGYSKTSSFFDNISSEARDRDEVGANRLGGREFRSEEQKKNFETFGAGSVDNGYRGGFRLRVMVERGK